MAWANTASPSRWYRQPVRQNLHRPLLRPHLGVAEYMQRTKEQAAVQSFVETLSGRRLYLPDTRNKNANARAGAERTAINTSMQGAASDLIKRAMTDVSRWLVSGSLKSKLIMRVHDKLALEAPEAKLDLVKEKLPQMMAKVDEEMLNCR